MPKMAMIALMSAGTISLATASYYLGRYGWPRTLRGSKVGDGKTTQGSNKPNRSPSRSWLARLGMMSWSRANTSSSSGNLAFDEYRSDTLKRLEEEQAEFEKFLADLRRAKDAKEFDEYIRHRKFSGSADEGVER